jgi:hypothetical protein
MAQARTITATDPLTGQTVTRKTARTYCAAVVWIGSDGSLHAHAWAGRPDLAAAALAKVHRAGIADARLAPVTGDPWAAPEPAAPVAAPEPVAEPVAAAPEPVAQARPRSLAPLAADLGRSLGLDRRGEIRAQAAPYPIRHNCTSEPARGPLLPGEPGHPPAPVAQGPGPELPPMAAPAPTGDAWAGQPWDPGTPEARAQVALQGERVATLWPIAQALTGAGVTLPGSWAGDGPVMAGEWPVLTAVAILPTNDLRIAAMALAALPPATAAQAQALDVCRGALASPSRP